MSEREIDQDELIHGMLVADDQQAIKILFNKYYRRLFSIVNQYIHNREDTDDLLQDLFIAIWTKRHSLDFKNSIYRYLIKSALNRAKNYKRNKSRSRVNIVNDPAKLETRMLDHPADSALSAEEVNALWKYAQSRMKSKAKTAFLLSRKLSMSYSEIAKTMGISEKAVEKNMSNALKVLREVFKNHFKMVFMACILQLP